MIKKMLTSANRCRCSSKLVSSGQARVERIKEHYNGHCHMTNSPPPSYVHNIHSVGVDFSVAQHTLLGSRPAQERPVRLVLQQLSGLLPA